MPCAVFVTHWTSSYFMYVHLAPLSSWQMCQASATSFFSTFKDMGLFTDLEPISPLAGG